MSFLPESPFSESVSSPRLLCKTVSLSVFLSVSNLLSATGDSREFEGYVENIRVSLTWGRSPTDALEQSKRMVERFPKAPMSYMLRARAFLMNYQPELALADAKIAKSLAKNDEEANFCYSEMLYENRRFPEAISEISKIVVQFGKTGKTCELLGKCYQNIGKYSEAIQAYEEAQSLGGISSDLTTNLLTARRALEEGDSAIRSSEDEPRGMSSELKLAGKSAKRSTKKHL